MLGFFIKTKSCTRTFIGKEAEMIKVTCIGDSIRQQYTERVRELLGNEYEMFEPNDNCRFAKYTLRGVFDWQNNMKDSRIVHWNCGLWDICNLFGDGLFTSETEYIENMLRIADILLKKHEAVIFATTTPVREENPFNKNADIIRYNSIIVPEFKKRGIIINDLFTPIYADINRYVRREDLIHLTPEGIEICAQAVAKSIKEAAERLSGSSDGKADPSQSDAAGAPVIFK